MAAFVLIRKFRNGISGHVGQNKDSSPRYITQGSQGLSKGPDKIGFRPEFVLI